ncbi:putative Ig domain-containing protein, partial [Pseudomonas sp. KB_15]|uniref:putative Ig domain-containing protein n=1 Tax=Pseudomonas sp. KB_15 TaxID=3233035 RepID=UPI003F9CF995
GPDSFTYTATNGAGTSAPATVTVTVSAPTINYALPSPTAATTGVPYSQSLAMASGGAAPYTYTLASGALPSGISLASNGTLAGTATSAGTYNFTVRATDSSTGVGPFSKTSSPLTLSVLPPTLSMSPSTLPTPVVAIAYSQTMSTSGGTAPYSYAVTSGTLPSGLA